MNILRNTISSVILTVPFVSFAAGASFADIVNSLIEYINKMVVIIIALSLLLFFWGLAMFLLKADDSGSHKTGRDLMLWGIIVFFVMGSIWGIVQLVSSSIFI